MRLFPVLLVLFGLIIIAFPKFLSFLIGGFFVFVGLNMLFISMAFSKKEKKSDEEFIKFGKYKIYRG